MSKSESKPGAWSSAGLWLPGLIVAISAAVATAHGLYEVVRVSGVPGSVAWTYPLITDGLAIVAYAATSRLEKTGRRYAWAVVILAAGLSGLAQAMYFVGDFTAAIPEPAPTGAPVKANPPPDVLRFGVGAWPAIAAAIVAHLLFMLSARRGAESSTGAGESSQPESPSEEPLAPEPSRVQPQRVQSTRLEPGPVQPDGVQSTPVHSAVLDASAGTPVAERPTDSASSVQPEESSGVEPEPSRPSRSVLSPKRDAALREARRYQAHNGALPTVDVLAESADVSRGTAGTVLKELRDHPAPLQLITDISTTKANS